MPLGKSAVRTGELCSNYPSVGLGVDQILPARSLPIPSREEIMNSPMVENHGATSGFTHQYHQRPPSPIMDDPSAELERELAGTHMRR